MVNSSVIRRPRAIALRLTAGLGLAMIALVVIGQVLRTSLFISESEAAEPSGKSEATSEAVPTKAATTTVKFNRDIRQLLSDNCYHCHGPDAKHREADLRLDKRDAALEARAIVPGKISESELVRRINSTDPEVMMPPPESQKKLSLAQKKLLTTWVTEGAEYEAHWAFTPLTKPAVPVVKNKAAVANAIDAFIIAELEENKLQPSPAAAKHEQLRRLSLDLIGLPPTPKEVAAFLADTSANAFEKQVDRLLASPHFGERLATWWLDVARFTDTVGYHGDQNARNFPYRDYVIDSFNNNKPFDLFTREQLAGDLLPNPTPEQLVATGFNRLNMVTREGGAQPKEYLAKYNADRVKTVATTWLGSTLGCAECHDHKFDPFKQSDFYALAAFFGDVQQWGVYSDYGYSPNPDLKGFNNEFPFPPEIEVESPALKERINKLTNLFIDKRVAPAAQSNPKGEDWLAQIRPWVKNHPTGWQVLMPEEAAKLEKQDALDEGFFRPSYVKKDAKPTDAKGKPDPKTKPTNQSIVTFPIEMPSLAMVRLELGKSADENKKLDKRSSVKLTFAQLDANGKSKPLKLQLALSEHAKPRYSSGAELLDIQGGWAAPEELSDQVLSSVWLLDRLVAWKEGDKLVVTIDGAVSPVRISATPLGSLHPLQDFPTTLLKALSSADPPGRDEIPESLLVWYLSRTDLDASELAATQQLIREIASYRNGKAWTLVTKSLAKPLPIRVFPRGNWQDESQPEILPATLHFLPGPKAEAGKHLTRLDLANWLCAPENPLTARTITNRLWKEFFGRGISTAVDDLGAQGDAPSHPELLDWLAVEFRSNGWDMKKLIKQIVLSNTYRQSARTRPELRNLDPNNRLLAFQNPRRLDAEFVRDNALSIAGILNLDLGGPSIKPYQPDDYYDALQFPNRNYVADVDDRQYRRGVYMHWQRTFLHPMLANFDAPSREECTAIRVVSNTPQQALTLLNDPTFVEAARAFAERLLTEPTSTIPDISRIDRAFEIALARPATAIERASLLEYLASQRKLFQSGEADPDKLLKVGLRPVNPKLDKVELAAWMSLCRVVLNLHETVTR